MIEIAFSVLQMLYNLFKLGIDNPAEVKTLYDKGSRAFEYVFGGEAGRTPEAEAQINKDYDDVNARLDKAYVERRDEAIALGLVKAD